MRYIVLIFLTGCASVNDDYWVQRIRWICSNDQVCMQKETEFYSGLNSKVSLSYSGSSNKSLSVTSTQVNRYTVISVDGKPISIKGD